LHNIIFFLEVNDYHNYQLQDWIAKCEHRSKFYLSQVPLSDRDMNIVIQQAMIYKQCTGLQLRADEITVEGISLLAEALRINTTLLTLDLRGNSVPDTGVDYLSEVLSTANSTLKLLNFSDNDTTDQGAEYLAEMLQRNEKLTHLWLDSNIIGDRGVQLLADALTHHNTSLEQLYLNGNKLVTDSSVDSLVLMLKTNQSLTIFEISDCNLSEAGKAKLRDVEKAKSFKLTV
jgi:Ran GTPase-activating protein (RanGAP) involved in mRNA processing and transport